MKHLINITDLSKKDILALLNTAQTFLNGHQPPSSHNKLATFLFFESSTRTLGSFQIAAQRLGFMQLTPILAHSSLNKGESIQDTLLNYEAMGTTHFVIRHNDPQVLATASQLTQARIINAGSGTDQHPTQALLDLLTIQQAKGFHPHLKIVLVGDIAHSRVANSLVNALLLLGLTNITLVGPTPFLRPTLNCEQTTNLDSAIEGADVVIGLRIQKERMPDEQTPEDYIAHYQINAKRLAHAKPDAIVMHPGPINRNIEMTSTVANSEQSCILQQVRNGVALRMALLAWP